MSAGGGVGLVLRLVSQASSAVARKPAVFNYPGHLAYYTVFIGLMFPVLQDDMKARISAMNVPTISGRQFKFEKGEVGENPELVEGSVH
jgi:hypothetical protein